MTNETDERRNFSRKQSKRLEPSLLEVMEICADLYLTLLLESQMWWAGDFLPEREESRWLPVCFLIDENFFFRRLIQIH